MPRIGGPAVLALALMSLACSAADEKPAATERDAPQDEETRQVEELSRHEEHAAALQILARRLRAQSDAFGLRHQATAGTLHRIGLTLHQSGDQEAAEEALSLAVALRRDLLGPRHPDLAESLYALGLVARYVEDRDRSWDLYRQALEILGRNGRAATSLADEIELAQASWMRGADLEQAIARYRATLARLREADAPPTLTLAGNLAWLGWTLVRAGRPSEGLPYAHQAEETLHALGMDDRSLMAAVLNLRSDDLLMQGRWRESEPLYERIIAIQQAARAKNLPGFSRRKYPVDGHEAQAWIHLQRGEPERAWSSLQKSKSSLNQDFLSLARWSGESPATWPGVRELRQAYLDARRALQQHLRACGPADRSWELWLRKLELRTRLHEMEADFLRDHPIPEPAVEDVVARLGARTAYVGWLDLHIGTNLWQPEGPAYATSWAYVLRPGREIRWIRLWEARGMRQLNEIQAPWNRHVAMTVRAVDWKLRVGADGDMRAAARKIGELWFDPILPSLDGIDTLVVERQDPVPIEALVGPDGAYLGDRFAISYSPSATAFLLLSERQRRSAEHGRPPAVLAVGGPVRARTAAVPHAPDAGLFPCDRSEPAGRLPPLPFSGEEAGRVASMFPSSTLLRGEDASEDRLSALARSGDLRRFGVIHIATHAWIDTRPERCALALSSPAPGHEGPSDGLVDAEEILYEWDLDADILSLSGCRTLRGLGLTRGEFVGFTQVLLAAGANSVVSSLWDLDDRASSVLMQRFYENLTGRGLAGPMPRAAALQEARRWARDYTAEDGRKPFEHPIYWSGLILLGAPR
ncbi:MAG: CHAT domain-containing protein [Candidatus Polarisedimenticolia bacterium]